MSLRLLLDEDSQSRSLFNALRKAKHDVLTANDAALAGEPDSEVLAFASKNHRIVVTRNCNDFRKLHQDTGNRHSGIFAIYQEHDSTKTMEDASICKAIQNIEKSGLDLDSQFIALNAWLY